MNLQTEYQTSNLLFKKNITDITNLLYKKLTFLSENNVIK